MSVARILRKKGRTVVTTLPTATLHAVIKRLAEHRIGALIVTDGREEVCGVISERDIVRLIAMHGHAVLVDPVSAHMTRDVRTCSENDSLDWVMNEMTEHRHRHFPVVSDEGRLTGIVSMGDVVKLRLAECTFEAEAMREYIVGEDGRRPR